MSHGFFATIFYIPLYNALVWLIDILPGHPAWVAVVLLTVIIRFVLYPLSKSSIKTQILMKQIEPEIQKIREKITDKAEQGRKTLELYRSKGINPFAGFLLLLIQLPIVFGLYKVFSSGLPKIDTTLLYSFVAVPESVAMSFFGLDLASAPLRIVLAILAVITQFIQINLALPKVTRKEGGTFQNDLAYSMNMQMRYILPLIMFPIAYISAVIALYLITTNIFMTAQEIFVKRRMERQLNATNK
ncbi:MAG: 60 kDa inner rane insertion protein preprotein translocase subunit YidC [Candidatus Paceibacter sp.]|jgi:YidC/Oxa1 family membrane protein insertase|nr:60 kDa inner rane insertion protein preprotein translocase subunit YidC [Candidatus Paceibacter sp.]